MQTHDQSTTTTSNQIAIERAGAKAGFNPVFGEWRQRFKTSPVPYSASSERREAFVQSVRGELTNKFLYSNFVSLEITLHFYEQRILESPDYGDLDNYAKSICDALKGKDAILIDDCLVQHLNISWIDTTIEDELFEIHIKSESPDDFVQKNGLRLYEMPDKLYYPMGEYIWRDGNQTRLEATDHFVGLIATATLSRSKRKMRHILRQGGASRLDAFQSAKYISPGLLGFHRTRAEASGLELVKLQSWRYKIEEFKKDLSENDQQNKEKIRIISEFESNFI